MTQARIWDVEINITNPLRLKDCWTDDPIGSGAMAIFDGNTQLSKTQINELKAIFHPFEGAIYPDHVHAAYTIEDIKKIHRTFNTNALYARELAKRKTRHETIHKPEHVAFELLHEIIWTTLTLELREWALKQGFDSFVYENVSESPTSPTDSYVILKKEMAGPVKRTYVFNPELYMQCDGLTLKDRLQTGYENAQSGQQAWVFGYIDNAHAARFWCPKP